MKHLLYTLYMISLSFACIAQTPKADRIIKLNGEEISGQITEVSDDQVKFVYTGETSVYTFKKTDIAKLIFGSGRVEEINASSGQAKPNTVGTGNSHANKIAILPFRYVTDGQQAGAEASQSVQNECYAQLSKHSGSYTLIDNRTTNALLSKAGISRETMDNFTMKEICDALDVAFVVTGMVTVNKTTQSSYSSNNQNSSVKKNTDRNKTNASTSGSSYSTVEQNYSTTVDLEMYNDRGESLYNQNRQAFWHQQDAYKSTMEYLLKRSPLYKK